MRKKVLISSLLSLALLSGCTSQMPEAIQGQNTQKGVAIGAVTGAVLGSVLGGGNKKRRIATGAVVGSVIGGAIGYNIDQQAKEVAAALDTSVNNSPTAQLNQAQDIIVANSDKFVKITFRDAMMFPTNSDKLTPSARLKIEKLVGILRNYPSTIVQVVGHTDNRGSHTYNQRLSQKRAATVSSIIKQSGIPNEVYKKGCSFDKPVAPNTDATNMSLNRRVEVFLYPNRNFVINQCI